MKIVPVSAREVTPNSSWPLHNKDGSTIWVPDLGISHYSRPHWLCYHRPQRKEELIHLAKSSSVLFLQENVRDTKADPLQVHLMETLKAVVWKNKVFFGQPRKYTINEGECSFHIWSRRWTCNPKFKLGICPNWDLPAQSKWNLRLHNVSKLIGKFV